MMGTWCWRAVFNYYWIRAAGDEAVRINGIPCGNEDVDLVGMGQERTHGLGIARQVEKGLGCSARTGRPKRMIVTAIENLRFIVPEV